MRTDINWKIKIGKITTYHHRVKPKVNVKWNNNYHSMLKSTRQVVNISKETLSESFESEIKT